MQARQYYALYVVEESGKELAFIRESADEELEETLSIALYTAPDGEAQRKHLQAFRYAGEQVLEIAPISREDLLEAMNRGVPNSVYLNGVKVAGSVFKARIKGELGVPLKWPRVIRPQNPSDPRE